MTSTPLSPTRFGPGAVLTSEARPPATVITTTRSSTRPDDLKRLASDARLALHGLDRGERISEKFWTSPNNAENGRGSVDQLHTARSQTPQHRAVSWGNSLCYPR